MSDIDIQFQLLPGRPYDREVRETIPIALRNIRMGTQETVRREVIKLLGREVSWHTVNSHLNHLVKKGIIRKRVITQGSRRTITIFSISA
jgi:hypothetical protein